MTEINTHERIIDLQPIYLLKINATGMPRAVFTQDFIYLLKQIFHQMHPYGFPQFGVKSPSLHRLRHDEDLFITVSIFDDFSITFDPNYHTNIVHHVTFPNHHLVLHILPDPNVTHTIHEEDIRRIAWVMAAMILERLPPLAR
jgi:hypothetical protein